MSQSSTNFADLARAFGPGRDLFDAPEEAFHAVIHVIRDELAPASILMFLTIESLIRSLKNQRRPVIHSIHDSRWQRDRAAGERMMCRMMTQLIKLTQPAKTNRAAKNPPQGVEPAPVLNSSSPEQIITTEPVNIEPVPAFNPPSPELIVRPEPVAVEPAALIDPPDLASLQLESAQSPEIAANDSTSSPPSSEPPKFMHPVFATDGTSHDAGTPVRNRRVGEIFHQRLAKDKQNQKANNPDIHQT
jgi:hypothetical protein